MSNPNSPPSLNAQRFFALLSNPSVLAKLTGRPSSTRAKQIRTPQGFYILHDAEDKIMQLPIASEDQVFSYYEDMKAQLSRAEDWTVLGEPALLLAENTKTLAEIRMGVIEVQIGCFIEIMSSMWPDYVKARLLAEDADATGKSLISLRSSETETPSFSPWKGHETLVDAVVTKACPFLEKNSFHRQSMKEFLENPAKLFSQTSLT